MIVLLYNMAPRIFQMIDTIGFLTALECTNSFSVGALPRTPMHGEAYSAHPTPISGLRGPTSKGKQKGRERGKRDKKGRRREREGPAPPFVNFWIRRCVDKIDILTPAQI